VVQDQITEEMKHHLNSVFTKEEVFTAIRDMKSLAAPGPAGLPAMFYHTYWDIVGQDITYITNAVLDVLDKGSSPQPYNQI
jgi:hypothetical protein